MSRNDGVVGSFANISGDSEVVKSSAFTRSGLSSWRNGGESDLKEESLKPGPGVGSR